MAHSSSSSAVSSPVAELSVVRVLDSSEPHVMTSSGASSSSKSSVVQVLDSGEPLGMTSFEASSSPEKLCFVQVSNSREPLASTFTGVSSIPAAELSVEQVVNSSDPLDTTSSGAPESSTAGLSGLSGRRTGYLAGEILSQWNLRKVVARFGTKEQCVRYAEEHNILPREKMCKYHKAPMKLYTRPTQGQLGLFRCLKRNCSKKAISRASGTWFEKTHLELPVMFELMYFFSQGCSNQYVQRECCGTDRDTVLSTKTISEWFNYCRECIVIYELKHQEAKEKIGGTNKIVEIVGSKFGKSKHSRGRQMEGHWVLGIIEDGNDDLRVELCPNTENAAEVLVLLIKKHVKVGTTIHTDYWKAYECLPEHGYIHKQVIQSDPENKLVASDEGHTQRIESQWRGLELNSHKDQYKGNFCNWLVEYSWRRKIKMNHKDPFAELLKAIEHVYKIV